ncbi:Potassium channel [Marasmius crinis-equi]|uniref:Potassium channel n=1 Tax=Marasmius crinis-equi TaxID=585013 RepID=A0ABR3FW20_9AGAR
MLLPVSLGFQLLASRSHHTGDPEKDGETSTSPTKEFYGISSHEGDEEEGHDDDDPDHLDGENNSETLEDGFDGYDAEEGHEKETQTRPEVRRNRWRSSTVSLASKISYRPRWYHKFKAFIFPPTSDSDIDSVVPNYRITPIISGLVIPFSILLEIPGLTEHWYIRTEDNLTVETKPNTMVLNVGLGLSMACALIANVALVTRFLEKHVHRMTLTCVVALTIHDIINITAVTIFGIEHRFDDGFTYGTSFWMTLCSTIASTFTNATLIVDVVRTPDFSNSGSGLSRKQRSLVIIVIILLCYIALGALIHCILLGIKFVDALYFTICSIETIGFGDVLPVTTGARVFTCLYATFGIINLALAVALARETVLEALEIGYRRRIRYVRERRRHVQWRRRVGMRWRQAVGWRLREGGKAVWVPIRDETGVGVTRSWVVRVLDRWDWMWEREGEKEGGGDEKGGGGLWKIPHPHGMRLNLEALTNAQLEAAALEAGVPLCDLVPPGFWKKRRSERERVGGGDGSGGFSWASRLREAQRDVDMEEIPLTHARIGKMIAMLGGFALAVGKSDAWVKDKDKEKRKGLTTRSNSAPRDLRAKMAEDIASYRSSEENEERKAFYTRFTVAWMLFIVFWMVGSGVFSATEGWSFGVAMYFCFISFTTIGYGDYSPKTPAGRSVFVVWALFGVATMTILISVVSEAFTSRYKNVLKAGTFTRMVEKYQTKQLEMLRAAKSRRKPAPVQSAQSSTGLNASPTAHQVPSDPRPEHTQTKDHHTRHLEHLEQLPRKIIQHCHTFREHLLFLSRHDEEVKKEAVPEALQKLLEDIIGTGDGAATSRRTEMQSEILQDRDARHTLFALSVERELRKMAEAAEDAITAMKHRDRHV